MYHCKRFATEGKYHYWGQWDLCAGKKKRFSTIQQMKKTEDGEYVFDKNVTNYIGLNDKGDYPFDYYVSGSDTCSGDSGGGAYQWKHGDDNTPVLIAITSRGFGSDEKNGCAELNFPGIYTRVSKYLNWIYEHSKDGKCED